MATSAAGLPSPPPSTKTVVLTLMASGSVSDLDTSSLQQSVAAAAGVDKSLVTIRVAAASVIITASIAVPASTTAAAVQASLSSKLATVEAASTVLGVTVESVPTVAISPVAASVDVGDNEQAMSGGDGNNTILLVVAICLFVLTGGIALLTCWHCRRKARQSTVATASAVTMGVQVEVDERGRPMAPRAQIVTALDVPMVPPQDQVLAVQGVPLRTTAGNAVVVPAASPRPPLAASSADDAFPL